MHAALLRRATFVKQSRNFVHIRWSTKWYEYFSQWHRDAPRALRYILNNLERWNNNQKLSDYYLLLQKTPGEIRAGDSWASKAKFRNCWIISGPWHTAQTAYNHTIKFLSPWVNVTRPLLLGWGVWRLRRGVSPNVMHLPVSMPRNFAVTTRGLRRRENVCSHYARWQPGDSRIIM